VSEAGPRLVALDAPPAGGAGGTPEPESPESQERRWTLRILFALLAFTLAALLVQTWRARELHSQIGRLESDLVASQAAVAAHQAHLSEVRSQVGDLEQGFSRLQELVSRPPAAP
jgi:cell division protein FtsB